MGIRHRRRRAAPTSMAARVRVLGVFALVGVSVVAASSSGTGVGAAPADATCAPLDVALIIDSSTSMNSAIDNVKDGAGELVDRIVDISGGDYRIGLVDFADDVQVRVPFSDRNADAVKAAIPELYQDRDNDSEPEAWDQALAAVVEGRAGTHSAWIHRRAG